MERELTATHWRGYAQQQFPQAAWSVDGDVLRAIASGPRVDLISRESFRDFVLYFDWRLPRGGSSAGAYPGRGEVGAPPPTGPPPQPPGGEDPPDGADPPTPRGG